MNDILKMIIAFVIMGGMAAMIGLSFISLTQINKAENLACKEIEDFVGYKYYDVPYCEDSEGNLHYAKIDCEGWPLPNCKAKIISIGDVRVK